MKKLFIGWNPIIMATLLVLCSCNDNEKNQIVTLDEKDISVQVGLSNSVNVVGGVGKYSASSEDEYIAKAVAEERRIMISGINAGKTIVWVRDEANYEVPINVIVEEGQTIFLIDRVDFYTEVENREIEQEILEELNLSTPITENIGYIMYYTGVNQGRLEFYIGPTEQDFIEGSFRTEGDVWSFSYDGKEFIYLVEPGRQNTKANIGQLPLYLHLVEDLTQYYQNLYPNEAIAKISRIQAGRLIR